MATTAVMFAPMSFGADSELPQNALEQADVEDAARSVEIAGRTSGAWHRPPADASINKFVVAMASAR